MHTKFQTTHFIALKTAPKCIALDYFVKNAQHFDELRYFLKYRDYVQKESNPHDPGSFLVHESNHLAQIKHVVAGKRFFGNSLMQLCDPEDINILENSNRCIKINCFNIFFDSMLFVRANGIMYKLVESEGFLQLQIPKRHTIKVIEKNINHFLEKL